MTSKEKGDYLEMIVGMLETALSDNPSTLIKMNYLIKDEDGFDREIDIYVETIVNREKFRYAFECKHYGANSKVEMSDIDSFYSKIRKTDIKGLFVSTGHYQNNAIEKAKKNSIEVWTIKENPDIQLFKELYIHKKRHKVTVFTPGRKTPDNSPGEVFELNSVYIDGKRRKQKISNEKLYINHIKPSIRKIVINNIRFFYLRFFTKTENSFSISIGRKETVKLQGDTKSLFGFPIYVKLGKKYHELDIFRCEIDIWIELEEVKNLIVNSYQSVENDHPIAQFITSKTIIHDDDQHYLSIVKLEEGKGYKFLMSNSKNKEVIFEANESIPFEADQIKITPSIKIKNGSI